MSPAKRSKAEHQRLVEEVDNFLTAFEEAKGKPGDGKLLDRLTASVIKLERARNLLR